MTYKRQQVDQIPEAARVKWGKEALVEGFVPFPKRFLRCLAEVLGHSNYEELQVILSIADYMRPDLRNPPSTEYLAFIAGLDEERFKKVMLQLKGSGLIDVAGSDEMLQLSLQGLKQAIEREAGKKA